jgi:hypothetical protein
MPSASSIAPTTQLKTTFGIVNAMTFSGVPSRNMFTTPERMNTAPATIAPHAAAGSPKTAAKTSMKPTTIDRNARNPLVVIPKTTGPSVLKMSGRRASPARPNANTNPPTTAAPMRCRLPIADHRPSLHGPGRIPAG